MLADVRVLRTADGRVWLGDVDTGLTLDVVRRPHFYDLTTADGVPYEQIARLYDQRHALIRQLMADTRRISSRRKSAV